MRGILQNDYNVDLSKVNFVTFTDGHVPEFKDPSNCTRAAAGKKMADMLTEITSAQLIALQLGRLKEAGKMRLEGKEYVVRDGDVMHFRFNV